MSKGNRPTRATQTWARIIAERNERPAERKLTTQPCSLSSSLPLSTLLFPLPFLPHPFHSFSLFFLFYREFNSPSSFPALLLSYPYSLLHSPPRLGFWLSSKLGRENTSPLSLFSVLSVADLILCLLFGRVSFLSFLIPFFDSLRPFPFHFSGVVDILIHDIPILAPPISTNPLVIPFSALSRTATSSTFKVFLVPLVPSAISHLSLSSIVSFPSTRSRGQRLDSPWPCTRSPISRARPVMAGNG